MKYRILLVFHILLRFGVLAKDTRIVGGSDADVREFPYTVSLRDISDNTILCGGAIISQRHVLTSATCFLEEKSYELLRIFTVRTSPRTVNGHSFRIDNVFKHPSFTGHMNYSSMNVYDISVIKVVETIEFNEFQNMIDLSTEYVPDGVDCIMTGWGSLTYPDNTVPMILQKAVMTIIDRVTCLKQVPFILHQGHLCGILNEGMGAVEGDSGDPLVCNNKLAGITSFNVIGNNDYLELYTDVHYYLDFIISTMTNDY